MTQQGLGNVEPTEAERARMLTVLDGLRQRIKGGDRFAPAVFSEKDGAAELRWSDGGRAWVVAWISGIGARRQLLVWRHPTYRYESDDAWIYQNSDTRG